jgi:hypothetical protein
VSREQLKKQLFQLTPNQLETYLMSRGWQCDGELSGLASIWHRPDEGAYDAEVVAPRSDSARDYRDRIVDAVLAVASYERREPVDVAKEIAGHFADHIRVRVIHRDVVEGTIPLNDGILLNQRARDLLASSAMSATFKRKHFSGKRPPETREFLNSLRLGQTEVGSYVVNVIAPLSPAAPAEQDVIPTTSITRMVTANLSAGLDALLQAIHEFGQEDDVTVFNSAVNAGVSANMCDALLGLSGEQRERGFEVTITPCPTDGFKSEPRTYVFHTEEVKILAAASEYYKDNYVLPDQTIRGFIKRLDRPPTDETGTITVEATILNTDKHVAIELGPDEYLDAVTAHKMKEVIECRGDVSVKARSAKLLNPSGFRVIRSGDLI